MLESYNPFINNGMLLIKTITFQHTAEIYEDSTKDG